MNNEPLVCVCVPVYNGEKFIEGTVKAILKQTYPNIVIKVIDNCSTDNTCAVVEAIEDSRIELIKNETNVGMTGNFNKCLEYATGKYLQILCADDKVAPQCIEKKVAMIEKNPNCTLVFSASEVRDETEKVILKRNCFRKDTVISGMDMLKKAFRKYNLFGEPSNVMLKVDAIKDAGLFDEKMYYAVDWEYWTRFCLTGDVCYVNEPLAYFYVRSTSETGTLLKKKPEIVKDDKIFVDLCKNNEKMGITSQDILMHNINGKIRLEMKMLFAKLKK